MDQGTQKSAMCIPTLPGGVLADTQDAGQLAMQVGIQSRAGRGRAFAIYQNAVVYPRPLPGTGGIDAPLPAID